MRKKRLIYIFLVSFLLLVSKKAFAQVDQDFYTRGIGAFLAEYVGVSGYLVELSFGGIASTFIRAALLLLGMVFISFLIYGGYLMLTAAGESKQVEKGREVLSTAVVGVAIVLAGYGITYWILRLTVMATQSTTVELPY